MLEVGVNHSAKRIYITNDALPILRLNSIEARELAAALNKAVEFVTEVRSFPNISIEVRP